LSNSAPRLPFILEIKIESQKKSMDKKRLLVGIEICFGGNWVPKKETSLV
jgi:hypothetical protein